MKAHIIAILILSIFALEAQNTYCIQFLKELRNAYKKFKASYKADSAHPDLEAFKGILDGITYSAWICVGLPLPLIWFDRCVYTLKPVFEHFDQLRKAYASKDFVEMFEHLESLFADFKNSVIPCVKNRVAVAESG